MPDFHCLGGDDLKTAQDKDIENSKPKKTLSKRKKRKTM